MRGVTVSTAVPLPMALECKGDVHALAVRNCCSLKVAVAVQLALNVVVQKHKPATAVHKNTAPLGDEFNHFKL